MVGPFGLAPKQSMAARALPLARALVRRGHAVTILLPPWSNPEASGVRFVDAGVSVVNLKLPPPVPVIFHLALALGLLRSVLSLRPAVVHCFKPKAYSGLVAWCLWWLVRARLLRVRLVVDADDWEGAGGWNSLEPYPVLLKEFFAWQERWGLTHTHAVTVASRALQTLVWALGMSADAVIYVPNGAPAIPVDGSGATPAPAQADRFGALSASARTDDPAAASAPAAATGEENVLLYTRFFEFDLKRVARICIQLAERHPALRFTVVGRGFFGEEQTFAGLLADSPAGSRTEWLGWLPASNLPAVFARATLALFPFDDTLLNRTKCSVKLAELLSTGVPVVADAVGQNAEYIIDGESGLLVPSGDEGAMLQAVERLLSAPELRQKLSLGARRRMREHYDWDVLVLEAEKAYGVPAN